MTTGEEIGYQDAIRQVHKSLHRRLKTLQEQAKSEPDKYDELQIRIAELEHIIQIVESLHR